MDSNLFSLTGRVTLITGGNGGLGHAIALAYRDAGASVVVTGRDPDKNRAIVADFNPLTLDVRDESAVESAVRSVIERFGRLDILVNNAGIFRASSVLELSEEGWNEVLDSNLKGAFFCAKHAARAMVASGGGKIINIGSMYSLFGHPASISYTTSKTGLVGLTRSLAAELSPHGIQVNALLPGWFLTDINAGVPGSARGEEIRRRTPAGRWGEGRDLAGAAIFLASRASDFVTGAMIPVDGGYHISDRAIHSE
jgi:2-deoxy-D-gluconate 3-dehydrogenase